MIEKKFQHVYDLFKAKFYDSICKSDPNLTVNEAFSLEIIYMLKEPTILEYASYMGISQPNATYKIRQLMEKGYLKKEVSLKDKRAFKLQVTDQFMALYRKNDQYIAMVMDMVKKAFDEQKVQLLEEMLTYVGEKLEVLEDENIDRYNK